LTVTCGENGISHNYVIILTVTNPFVPDAPRENGGTPGDLVAGGWDGRELTTGRKTWTLIICPALV
jgi:hypothetical protein